MNTYELEVRAACPVHDGQIDLYRVTVMSQNTIRVEDILKFFADFADIKIFQEDLTAKAATTLGARVVIVGAHSGVKVTCEY